MLKLFLLFGLLLFLFLSAHARFIKLFNELHPNQENRKIDTQNLMFVTELS